MAPNKEKKAITEDERFKGVHNDPRFKIPRRNDFKVKVDDRFKAADLKSLDKRAKIDKYGRKLEEEDITKNFEKFYEKESASEEESDESEEVEEEEAEEEASPVIDRARGEGPDAESSSDESSSDESSSDESSSEEEESDEETESAKPEAGDPEKRFAVVNLDWDHVKSTDLMATFQSFVPGGGLIESVYIYPSEFGKERLQREEIEGPPKEVFKSKKKQVEPDSESDSEIEAKDLYEEEDGKEDYASKSLRRYQLQRLRYYYAVVTCDSINTAKTIYDNCDGSEYEATANFFDLRFIPEDMEFDDKPRDFCNKVPSNYKPIPFVTNALQDSKVKLTWDETPAERMELSSKAFSQRELDDMDFKAYLASDNSDEEDEDLKNKYKNLAGLSRKIGDKDVFENDDKDDVDMEITFTPGLEKGEEEKQEHKEESTIDKLKRKAKERRKSRKEQIKEIQDQEKKSNKEEKRKGKNDRFKSEKSKAELELLMLDEEGKEQAKHFSMKELIKSEKEKSKKAKHRKEERIIEDDFKPDLNDPRFKEIFTNHDFAIDPSQPQFKQTSTMKKIMEERNKRHNSTEKTKKDIKKRKLQENTETNLDVKSLVQKLKSKAKK